MNDLTGHRFGRLVAVRPTDERKNGMIMWECLCDCGNLKLVRSSELTQGKTKSCGCLKKDCSSKNGTKTRRDITGVRFGRLTAIRPTEKRLFGAVVWECLCDCGNTTNVSLGNLNGGSTKSCGCLHKDCMVQAGEQRKKDLTGQRFGKLVAIEPTEQRKQRQVVWRCNCDCGNTAFISSGDLRYGNAKSCGCVRQKNRLNSGITKDNIF